MGIRFIRFAFFFIAVNFLNMGYLTPWLNLYFGIILLLSFLISYFPFNLVIVNKKLLVLCLISFIFGFVLLPNDIILRLIGIIFILFGFGLFLKGINHSDKETPVLLFATAGYLFLMIFYKFNPFVWTWMQKWSLSLTAIISSLIKKDILLGHTFLGLHPLLLLIFIVLSSYLFSSKKKIFPLIITLFLIIVSQVVYVIAFAFLGETSPNFLLILPALFPLFLPIPLYFNLRHLEFQFECLKNRFIIPIILLLVCFSMGSLTLTYLTPNSAKGKEKIVFYTKGVVNWGIPNFQDFSIYNSGMFDNLPLFAARLGFEPNWTEIISQEILKEAKTLVMMNVEESLLESEKEAIWDFVKNGGSLLLLENHTFYNKGRANYLNEILEPVNIRLNFDSVKYLGGWLHSYEYLNHHLTIGLEDVENEPGIVVGSSLKVRYPAYPIIMGKYGHSDSGNLDYEPGEQLGDLVLAACQNYGKGKVLVFGDASSFTNSMLVFSHNFVNRAFTWLVTDKRDNFNYLYLFISLISLIVALVLFLIFSRNVYVLICLISLPLIFICLWTYMNKENQIRIPKGNIAYVDSSHSLNAWKNKEMMRELSFNLMRNGYLSFGLKDFSKQKILNSNILIFIAPNKPFSNKEIEVIKEYVRKGGKVILSVGYEEKNASLRLMNSFGFRILNVPLGYFEVRVKIEGLEQIGTFYKAWPVSCNDKNAQVICSRHNYPLIVSRVYGKGKFVVIGDSLFFSNQILKGEKQPIYFFRWLLHTLK